MSKSAGERITFCVYRKTSKRRPWVYFVFEVIYGLHSVFGAIYGLHSVLEAIYGLHSVFGAIYGLHSVFGAIDGLHSVFGAIYGLHSVFGAIYGLHSEMDFFLRFFFRDYFCKVKGRVMRGLLFKVTAAIISIFF